MLRRRAWAALEPRGSDRPYRPNNDGFNSGHAGPPARHIRMLRSVNSYEEVRDSKRPSVRPTPTHVWRWGACGELPAGAQAQAAGMTLTSGSPGTLTVSWNTPSPAPTDYRLRWAPVGSGYLSWKGTNETDRGNAYPAGDATSLTLSGLSEGTEFKVQARARYHKGEHKSSPWSGPWVEVQARVMSQPAQVRFRGRFLRARGAQPHRNRGDPRRAGLAVVAEPGGRLDHRLPGPAGPGRRLPCRH